MHKSVKIKAFLIFIAWGVVFLHGIIPHNHLSEPHGYCQSLLHDSDGAEHSNTEADHFKDVHNEHEKVCHFSTIMFQPQGFEELLSNTSQKQQIIPVAEILSTYVSDQNIFRSRSETGPSLLRAPPAA